VGRHGVRLHDGPVLLVPIAAWIFIEFFPSALFEGQRPRRASSWLRARTVLGAFSLPLRLANRAKSLGWFCSASEATLHEILTWRAESLSESWRRGRIGLIYCESIGNPASRDMSFLATPMEQAPRMRLLCAALL
jgi:hypothetical protein